MACFSSETKRALEVSGWHEDRQIDISEYERALLAAGHEVSKPVCDFLRCYGDLKVVASEEFPAHATCLNTCLSEILKTPLVSHFSPNVSQPLYSIGTCEFDFMYLLMDDAGRIYRHMIMTSHNFGGIDLFRIADSGEEAIEKLVLESRSDVEIQGERIAHHD